MIRVAVHIGPPQLHRAGNFQPIRLFRHLGPHFLQGRRHHRQAIALLHAQLFRIANYGFALGHGCRHGQNGDFIDQPRNQGPANFATVEGPIAHPQICHRFAGRVSLVFEGDVGSHLVQHVEDTGAGGVNAHVLDRQVRAGHDRRRHQPKGR